MMLNSLIQILTSLRLTVACLFAAIILVFFGTLAQVELGLYVTQEQYFRSLFVFWTPEGSNWRIPVWPGGYLLGGVLLANLIAAHIKRFKFTPKRSGIFLTHIGLILLLVGQFLTEVYQVESFMRIEEGNAKNYSEDGRGNELAVIDVTDPNQEKVVALPQRSLVKGATIDIPDFPLSIRVKEFFRNSVPGGPMVQPSGARITATQGAGLRLPFDQQAITAKMDDENKPVALVEVVADGTALGEWTVSTWLTKHPWSTYLKGQLGASGSLIGPQTFQHAGRTYELALRPVRYYKSYTVKLLDFTHARYKGTDIPKDFSSRIHLSDPGENVERDVLIYMNNPLRYGGETYYQGGFEPGDTVSILQVVKNPAWLTPYLSCILVGVGLLVQFGMHLTGFLKKSRTRAKGAPGAHASGHEPATRVQPTAVPAGAVNGAVNRSHSKRNS